MLFCLIYLIRLGLGLGDLAIPWFPGLVELPLAWWAAATAAIAAKASLSPTSPPPRSNACWRKLASSRAVWFREGSSLSDMGP